MLNLDYDTAGFINKSKKYSMKINTAGYLQDAIQIPSPNYDERPIGSIIRLLVIHNISLPPNDFGGNGIIELFTNQLDYTAHPYYTGLRDLKVSCHFLIRRQGKIIQFVSCEKRAWHAGQSCWQGKDRCNDFSIGIELEGSDTIPFETIQYHQLVALTLALNRAYPIEYIVGHADIAPTRKTDPGPFFDWKHFRKAVQASIPAASTNPLDNEPPS